MWSLIAITLSCGTRDIEHSSTHELKKWEKITLSFDGPTLSEESDENPFLDYRLDVSFMHGQDTMIVPGFFAADGHAAESSTTEGNQWQVRFRPSKEGTWNYKVSFRKGKAVAVATSANAGTSTSFDGQEGTINVTPNPGAKGRVLATGEHYLKFADEDRYFLKGGADSPENFLAYYEFDGTIKGDAPEQREGEAASGPALHRYDAHVADWHTGDPVWQDRKGKGIIGALNYLAGKGMNSVYFLTMNIEGDGKDVWPYTGYDERFRFDCSKLDQWEIIFDHMDRLGLMLHVVLQETENEKLLDNGDTKTERKLYLRELIARFSHHLMVTWNIGEENGPVGFSPNGQSTEQQKAMITYLKESDPYRNFVVVHTHSNPDHIIKGFDPLLGFEYLDGMSLQIHDPHEIHEATKYWLEKSEEANRPWVINLDELGPANRGIDPDDRPDNNQDTMRGAVLWGNLMAGGGGVEWYFGYKNHDNDLGCEDWRSRDRLWDYTRYGLDFFQAHLPFTEMMSLDDLVTNGVKAYCFAKPGQIYAIYTQQVKNLTIDLSAEQQESTFSVQWYNPRSGGALQQGSATVVTGGHKVSLGAPPSDIASDWTILLKKN